MISHTVYRGRNNEIILQLQSNDAPLDDPAAIDNVELTLGGVTVDSTGSDFIDYDAGVLTMRLGRVTEVAALVDGNHLVEVTGYGASNDEGIAFGSFMIYLRNWGGEVPSGS
jgi:hypothetical protein